MRAAWNTSVSLLFRLCARKKDLAHFIYVAANVQIQLMYTLADVFQLMYTLAENQLMYYRLAS